MSSSITEVLVSEGKLLVHLAENGHSLELDCNKTTVVEAVMRYVESVYGIGLNDQLVLCMDMKLEPGRPLSAYKLPSVDREVFVFNKVRLQSNSPPPPLEQVDILEVSDPPSPALSRDPHPLDDAPDPALKALPSYERQFRYHYHRGDAIYCRTQVKYEHCERLIREQKVQERALLVGRGNLDQYYRMINQNYTEFMKRYAQQHRIHTELLTNFERDLEKLRSIKLHPALQMSARKCLVDFVKEENLRKTVEQCSNSHRQFAKKVSEFKQMFADVKRKVEELFAWRTPFSIKNPEVAVKENQRFINEQKSIMQSLSKDVNTVKKLVDDCLSCPLSSSLRPHDAVSALGPMYDVHDKSHLPKMQACDCSISKLLEFCKDKKNEMNIFVHNYMQKIAYISYSIKNAKLQFPVFREAMIRQEDLFMCLKLIRGIGPAYGACLAEVVRRKASMKLYMGMAGQLAEKLAMRRAAEVRRREEFLKAHSSYIPKDVLASMGLYDTPSQCDVNIAPFDTNLLDIDISDLDCYAPECLAGLPLKSEKLTSLKSSFSTSNDSSHSAEVEEVAGDTFEHDESHELLEDCELVEIAGTSKMEVENAKLKAELASAIALICSLCPDMAFESLDDSKMDVLVKNAAEKTAEALQLKDEYVKHLQLMLKAKQKQCLSYEKHIQELEQRLSDWYLDRPKLLNSKEESSFAHLALKDDDSNHKILCSGEAQMHHVPTLEPMDEVSCISNSLDEKLGLGLLTRQSSKGREGLDENMLDSSSMQNTQLDSSMPEPNREELPVGDKDWKDKMVAHLGMSLTNSSTAESIPEFVNTLPSDQAGGSKVSIDLLLELQCAVTEKSKQLNDIEMKLKSAVEEISMLTSELEMSRKLLDESQMNCAHLENCLHEARKEAQTHLCAADWRASEYTKLRNSALKMHSLFERIKKCVCAPGGVTGLADGLRGLAQSVASSVNEKNEDDGTAEFRRCVQVLAEKVGLLSRHHKELLEKCTKFEGTRRELQEQNLQLRKELEEKKDSVLNYSQKYQLEKQAKRERICFNQLEIQEKAAFVRNSAGHYEAISQNCSNHYLSAASVALFTDLPTPPSYVVGQIMHIEQQIVKSVPPTSTWPEHGRADQVDQLTSGIGTDLLAMNLGSSSNPYGLPIGCEYFVVTIAMLPDTSAIRSPSAS